LVRRIASRLPALLAGILLVSSTVTCSESPAGPKSGLRALVGLSPTFSKAATDIYRNLVSFELAVNNIRVRFARVNGEIALDTTVAVVPGQDSIVLELAVTLESGQEVLEALIELRDGELVLFSATQTVTARAGLPSAPPPPIELEYSGPGATAVSLDVDPDTTISARDSLSFRPVARDANNQVQANLILNWSLSDATMGEVTAAGLFRPSGKRGAVTVTAELPTGIQGSATVSVIPVPTTITLVSGGGQTAIVGTAVAQPMVVELRASDNLPVAGHAVGFAVSAGGGSVVPASAVTDANGRASAMMTLGTTAGANSVAVAVTGLSPMTVSATGTAGAATKLAVAQQPAATTSAGAVLPTQPTVQLQDVYGNAAATAGVDVTAGLAVPPGGRTLSGTFTSTTNAAGVAAFTNLSIAGPTGTAALTFSAASLTGTTSSTITVVAGAANALSASGALTMSDSAGAAVAAAQLPAVILRDASNNPVSGVLVKFRRRGATGATINALSDTMVLVTTSAGGTASLTARRLQTVPGSDTVLVTAAGLNDTLRFAATVTHASAAQLAFVQQPTSAVSGSLIAPPVTVAVRDQFGNAVTTGAGATAPVTLGLTGGDGTGVLGPNTGALTQGAVAGVATFNVSVNKAAANYALTASGSAPIAGATSSTFAITAGAGSSITVVTTTAFTDSAGASLLPAKLPSVVVLDAASNPVAGVLVKFRRHGGAGASINGLTDTMVVVTTDANGAAALSARRLQTLVGVDTVLVTAAGLTDTLPFVATVTHANATQLAYTQQPPNGTVGATLSPAIVVAVRDQFGNPVTSGTGATASVTVALVDGTLSGTSMVSAVAGVATFGSLAVQSPGSSHQLVASAAGLTSATSAAFSITAASATTRTWTSATDGTWETASNWSGGIVPGAADTAVIALDGTYSVTISSAVSVGKVVIGATNGVQGLAVVGGTATLTVSDSIRVNPSGFLMLGTGGGGTVLSGGAVKNMGVIQWLQGAISGPGAIEVVPGATMMIAGDQPKTLSQKSIANAGTVLYTPSAAGDLTISNGSTIVNQAGGELLVQGDGDFLAGAGATSSISNAGFYRKIPGTPGTHAVGVVFTNTGVLEILEGGLSFQGANTTNAAAGTITGTGSIDVSGTSFLNAGTLAPGFSPGQLAFNGILQLQSTSTIGIELGGATPVTAHDVVSVTGALVRAGTLDVSIVNGYEPAEGDSLTVLTWSSSPGAFAAINLPALGGGLSFDPVVTATGLSLVVRATASATITWVNTAGGNWSTASNWSPSRVPTNSDTVALTTPGTGMYTVTLDVDATIAGLVVGSPSASVLLTGTGRTLTINGDSYVDGSGMVILTNSNLAGTGTLTQVGEVQLVNTVVGASTTIRSEGLGVLELAGGTIINGPFVTTANSDVRVNGSSLTGAASVEIVNGFTNNGRLWLVSSGGTFASTLTVTNGTLVNSATGAVSASNGGTRTLIAQLSNQGLLAPNVPLTIDKAGADHINSGSIDLQADLTITQSGSTPSFTNSGDLLFGANRTLTVTGGTLDLTEGSVNGPTTGRIIVTGATLAMSPASVNGMPLTLNTTTLAAGSLAIGDGEVVRLQGGTVSEPVNVLGGATAGTLITSGTVSLNGALTIGANGVLSVLAGSESGTTLTVANGFANNGNIELTGTTQSASLAVTTGSLTNASGGRIRTDGSGARTLNAQIDNQNGGTIEVDAALTINKAEADHINSGSLDLSGANLTVTQSGTSPTFTNTGTANVNMGANVDWAVTGGTLSLTQGAIIGSSLARVIVNSATLALAPSTLGVPLTLNSTTISGGSVTVANGDILRLRDGTMSATVTVQGGTGAGTLTIMGNTSITGALSVLAGGVLSVAGQSTGNAALTVANGFTNSGDIELTSATTQDATLTVTSGPLTNASGGRIRSLGTGGARTLAAQLQNQAGATVDVVRALTIDKDGIAHTNDGTINVDADLTVSLGGASPSFTNTGTIDVAADQDLTVTTESAATGAILGMANGTVTGNGTTRLITGGTSPLSFSMAPTAVALPLQLGANTTFPATVTIETGQTLNLMGNSATSTLTAAVSLDGGTLLATGTVALNGAVSVGPGGTLRVQGQTIGGAAAVTVASGFTNNGIIELTSLNSLANTASLNVTSGRLTNASGATILSKAPYEAMHNLGAALTNQGTVTVDAPLTIAKVDGVHFNSGAINIAATAYLNLNQPGTDSPGFSQNASTATVTMGNGGSWTVAGGALNLTQGLVQSPGEGLLSTTGTVALSMSTAAVKVPVHLSSTTTIAGGAITIPSGEVLTLNGLGSSSTLNANLTVQGSGELLVFGSATVDSIVNVEPGGLVTVRGRNTTNAANLTVASGFANYGLIELTSIDGEYPATLTVTTGTLTNASIGAIHTEFGTGGTRTLAAQLDNQGYLDVDAPLTLAKLEADHVNSGTINQTQSVSVTQSGTSPSFTNTGLIQLRGQSFTVTGGTMTNAFGDPSGTIEGPGTLNTASTTFTNDAQLTPTDGIVSVVGPYVQGTPNGFLNIEIRGASGPGASYPFYDQLAVSGAATLAGTLKVRFGDFAPSINDEYTVMTYGSKTGTFILDLPALGEATQWQVTYNLTSLVLKVVGSP
jgi:fibronectin-binding autotransporter adhesin